MNNINLLGRMVREPELQYTTTNKAYLNFTLAVNRAFKNKETGDYEADFINCVAWNKTAEIIAKNIKKGNQLAVNGTLQTRTYEVEGSKRFITEVIVNNITFVSPPAEVNSSPQETTNKNDNSGFTPAVNISEEDLPF